MLRDSDVAGRVREDIADTFIEVVQSERVGIAPEFLRRHERAGIASRLGKTELVD